MARPAAAVLGLCLLALAAQVSAAGEKELAMYATVFESMASKAKLEYSTGPWNADCVNQKMATIMYECGKTKNVSEAMGRAKVSVPTCCKGTGCETAAGDLLGEIGKLLAGAAGAGNQEQEGEGLAGVWTMLKPKLHRLHGEWFGKCDAKRLDGEMPAVLKGYFMEYGTQHRLGNDDELREATRSSCGEEMPPNAIQHVRDMLEGMMQSGPPPARLWAMPRAPLLGRAAQPGSGFYVAAVAAAAAIAAGAFLAGKRVGERRGTPMLAGAE